MKKSLASKLSLTAAVLMLVGSASGAFAAGGNLQAVKATRVVSPVVKLVAHATGAEESTSSNAKMGGAPTGFADATFRLDRKTNRLCYSVTTYGLTGVVAGHIHKGAKGVDGGVSVALNAARFNHGTTCLAVAAALITDISKNPKMYYFNVHSKVYSDGAARGQLMASK